MFVSIQLIIQIYT